MSKKLTITMLAIQAVISMGVSAPVDQQFKYACLIAGLALVYKVNQSLLDYFKDKNSGE